MIATNWKKGDAVSVTTTTAGAEMLEIVTFVRRNGRQFVILASAASAEMIRRGELDFRTVILTGIGGRVREMETQYFHRLAARGLAVKA
jgi:hypothetical protein